MGCRLAAAIVLKITYGYSIERKGQDPLVELIEHAMENLSQAFVPLAWAVDSVPAIKYLPDWFPGMSYRKTARKWRAINEAAAELLTILLNARWRTKPTSRHTCPIFSRST